MNFANSCAFNSLSDLPPCIALYGVFSGETLLYIGTAVGLRRRLKAHHKMVQFFANNATEVRWNVYTNNEGEKLNADEQRAIEKLQPPLNGNNRVGRKTERLDCVSSEKRKNPRDRSALHQATFDLLWARIDSSLGKTQTLDNLANETGLNYHWLDSFARDLGGSPAVERVECLYNYLAKKPLKVNA